MASCGKHFIEVTGGGEATAVYELGLWHQGSRWTRHRFPLQVDLLTYSGPFLRRISWGFGYFFICLVFCQGYGKSSCHQQNHFSWHLDVGQSRFSHFRNITGHAVRCLHQIIWLSEVVGIKQCTMWVVCSVTSATSLRLAFPPVWLAPVRTDRNYLFNGCCPPRLMYQMTWCRACSVQWQSYNFLSL